MDKNLGKASVPAVNQYLALAQEQGINIESVLERAGISGELFKDNSQHITGLAFQTLIDLLIDESDDELFGLHTAKFVQPGSYSVLGYISMNCDTLGQAITKIAPFEKLVGDMGTTDFGQAGPYVKLSWLCQFPDIAVRRHMIDNCLASWITFARYLVDHKGDPVKVLLSRNTPDLAQQTEYRHIFGCPVVYNQAEDAILFEPELLSHPLNKGDQQLLSTLESHANKLITDLASPDNLLARVVAAIEKSLSTGNYHQQDIAGQLEMSGKTLQRRLAKENTSFQFLLDETRLRLTKEFLADLELNLDQISSELGFSEPRSFYRWFQKLTGSTPGNYRKIKE
ncbi:AraC family transcriptional regulator [Thalassomonas actiniarum]|uniref:AraC family transcriptional regulator n=1 Tax=Thalassomonas actiniarum TaxID=485447 RepID=A0AAE9YXG2_9GAMM|nr:AraC family transcriptional regulator [Thalassomonas actiniarum]WDE02194.1 AraC family transcriptional regulator [Thalassomonas actiniarum]